MNIFVGNLSFEANEHDVLRLFRRFGDVLTITIIMDKNGVKSRGFGFVEMPDAEKARQAIAALDGSEFMGRNLNVSPARPKPEAVPERPAHRPRFQPDRQRSERQFAAPAPRQGQGALRRPSRIKNGRRSRSFLRRTGAVVPPLAGSHPPRHDSRRWKKENEAGGEVIAVKRNLKPWQKRKGPAPRRDRPRR